MDDAILTDNIHRLIERSHKYQSSTNNFFQTHKLSQGSGSVDRTPQKSLPQFKRNQTSFKIHGEKFRTDTVVSGEYFETSVQHLQSFYKNENLLSSTRNQNLKSMFLAHTFMINLANQNLESFPQLYLKNKMTQVQFLDLQDNRLRIFPKELYGIINLKVINLNSNFIKALPNDLFQNFSQLQNLSINNNLIPSVHYSISNWASHLNSLDISHNRIDSINSLTNLTELITLFIHSNEFKILSFNLIRLLKLKEFSLDWFKYLQPPQLVKQKESDYINKLFNFMKISQSQQNEDPSIINISCDDIEQDEGIQFKEFVQYFSDSKSILPQKQSNPQVCEEDQIINQTTIIHKAAVEQDIGVLLTVIHDYGNLIDQEDANGYTALALSIREEKYFSAKTLIFNGANVNKCKITHGSVLNLAIVKGQIHMIQDLLQHNADTKKVDSQGNGALHYCMATFDKDTKIFSKTLNLLLKYGVNPNKPNHDGWTAMHLAIKKGVHEAVEVMINHNSTSQKIKFDFNLRGGKKGLTSLHIAAQNCNFEITQILLLTEVINALSRNNENKLPSQYCPHNYKQYKLLKNYEYKQIFSIIFRRNKILQDQLFDFEEVRQEGQHNQDSENQIQDGISEQTKLKLYQLLDDLFVWKEKSNYFSSIYKHSIQDKIQSLEDKILLQQEYGSNLLSFYSRAKSELFKDYSKADSQLSFISIILKVRAEITPLQFYSSELNCQLGKSKNYNQQFTEAQVQNCLLQFLNTIFKITNLNQHQILSCPDPAPRKNEKRNTFSDNSSKSQHLRNSYLLPHYFLQPSIKRSGQTLIQIEQPQNEVCQDVPQSPSNMNESYQDESQSNFEEIVKPNAICNLNNVEDVYLSELLVKVQSHQQLSYFQRDSLLQLVESTSILTAFEAFQSIGMLQTIQARYSDPIQNNLNHQIHQKQAIQSYIKGKMN